MINGICLAKGVQDLFEAAQQLLHARLHLARYHAVLQGSGTT
jgi:hypothetical protein